MRSLHPLLILISSVLLLTTIQPLSAQLVKDERKVKSFENIVISASVNTYVHISYDRSHKITVKADGRSVDRVHTTVVGDTLSIHVDQKLGNAKVEIYVRLPKVKKVKIAGGGVVDVIDGVGPPELQATVEDVGLLPFVSESASIL